ncbi:(d)CMP kinase [Stenotrophobium rhamnosiphilum]|uniref:Cytidylate kinase n=1 Tax=Stenotrophobium rhamnosiphilum TaxID=2029166 RepID=A0A2T5MEU5_9GAMM|nr:(d)CMP kinase [Stenotrophobium rhamnosiphilum]PTU31093.1 (d)CMP kinase [Stenotrophobium rhamnosiphilum]
MTSLAHVVAVDGPSGVGKGMVTRALTARLPGWHLLDSGALYRLLALAAHQTGIELTDAKALAALAPNLDIKFSETEEKQELIILNNQDVTRLVRTETTGGMASKIASIPEVRVALLERQHAFRQNPGLIADGRDIGTVIFPDAVLKIFLDASPDERARRRLNQLREAGISATLDDLRTEIFQRDERDRSRAVAPLVPASDAVTIDTTSMPPAEVLAKVDELLKSRGLI